jgi:type III pantothenate kinase
MILTIDIGNTRIKSAVFEQNTIVEISNFHKKDLFLNLNNLLLKYENIDCLVVSSVTNINEFDFAEISKIINVKYINSNSIFPFENLYATPKTLGIDRMVLASGAVLQFPNKNRLVIDAGTCVTYDYINDKNQYLGGAISPGLKLRYESLNNFTANLPLLTLESPNNFIGNSTNQSIHSGVVNGLLNEINGFIDQFEIENSNFIIILTGGDADFLAKRLKNTIFANSNFLLESLNQIYNYKNSNA